MSGVTFIIGEHREGREWISKMLDQVEELPMKREAIIVTSADYYDFMTSYDSFHEYNFPIRVIGNQRSCGGGRNTGGLNAAYEYLIWVDAHVCFTPEDIFRLIETLDAHPGDVVGPAVVVSEFPGCEVSGGKAHGVRFSFVDTPFRWEWIPAETEEHEFEVPMVCGCAFSMSKEAFLLLSRYGGFLHSKRGLGAEEEFGMRMWRLGRKVWIEPRAKFGHYFKGYEGHRSWDEHSASGFYESRVAAIYINVFNKDLCNHITEICSRHWREEWDKNLQIAREKYRWLREKLRILKNNIDERWFFRY